MTPISFFSTHTGANGAGCGAIAAGLVDVGGIELEPYPVQLYRQNFGQHIRHESILDTPIEQLPDFDFLWASPPCPSFSLAKTNGAETPEDIAQAQKVAEIFCKKRPHYFALENVRGYLNSESFSAIIKAVDDEGYNFHYDVYDSADYGVPQNRHRLILRASRDPLGNLPQTHSKTGGLWWKPWNGWYDAVADLLPTCKSSHLTDRQIQALENKSWDLRSVLVEGKASRSCSSRDRTLRATDEPCMTIVANQGGGGRSPKALLVEEMKALNKEIQLNEKTSGHRDYEGREIIDELRHKVEKLVQPVQTLLVDSKGNRYGSTYTAINGEARSFTVTANMDRNISRAVIIERTGYGRDRDPMVRESTEPSQTIRASVGCDGKGGYRSPITALLEFADVRALDYRCLARLQSFPDWYKWGDSSGKNCKAIGNACPPLFTKKIIESIVGVQN